MSQGNGDGSNGVIRIGRKGVRRFAFGADGAPFEVDVVVAFQHWVLIDDGFRESSEDRIIPVAAIPQYHAAALAFVQDVCGAQVQVTTAEALDFIARLREEYDTVAAFFRPRSPEERDSPDTSEVELQFSVEGG